MHENALKVQGKIQRKISTNYTIFLDLCQCSSKNSFNTTLLKRKAYCPVTNAFLSRLELIQVISMHAKNVQSDLKWEQLIRYLM